MARRKAITDNAEVLVAADIPVLPVRDTVLYPHMVSPLFVGRERSVKAIEEAVAKERTIAVVAQRKPDTQDPTLDDLYTVGTEAVIGRVLKMPDGTTSVLVQGQRRIRIHDLTQVDPFLRAKVSPIEEPTEKTMVVEALMRAVLALFEKCVKLSRSLPDDAYVAAMNIDEPGWLADLVASTLEIPVSQRQEMLECFHSTERLQKINILLAKELDVLELEDKIHTEVQQEVDKTQREYFMREQIKAIQKELGEADVHTRDINELREKVAVAGMPEEVAKKAEDELNRLSAMPSSSPEVAVIRTYVDWLVSLPWNRQ
ncbi:MAG: LON peptidase substrate-binding domain-containing protein, partial [Chloroflexi bacterium]|nr:LON peptidase substrate-binding domain-containing protein [Chloroflexota bacterium]